MNMGGTMNFTRVSLLLIVAIVLASNPPASFAQSLENEAPVEEVVDTTYGLQIENVVNSFDAETCEAFQDRDKATAAQRQIFEEIDDNEQILGSDVIAICEDKYPRIGLIFRYSKELVFALLLAALAGLTSYLYSRLTALNEKFLDALFSGLSDPFINSKEANHTEKAINVLLAGTGGSGKTSILRALSGSERILPYQPTEQYDFYILINEISSRSEDEDLAERETTRIYVDDYKGQWSPDAVNPEFLERKDTIGRTTLVIVVDIAFPPQAGAVSPQIKQIDEARVQQQLELFNTVFVQTLTEQLSRNDEIILFINKIDLIDRPIKEVSDEAKRAYSELLALIQTVTRKPVYVVCGSATTGLGLTGYDQGISHDRTLYQRIVDAAKPIKRR